MRIIRIYRVAMRSPWAFAAFAADLMTAVPGQAAEPAGQGTCHLTNWTFSLPDNP